METRPDRRRPAGRPRATVAAAPAAIASPSMRCCWRPPSMPAPGERVLDLGAGVGAVGLCLAARLPGCTRRRHRAAAGPGRAGRTQCHPQRHGRPGANDRSRPRPAAAGRSRPRSTMSSPTRPTSPPRSPIPRPIRARRWQPSNPAPTWRAGWRWRRRRLKPAGTLTLIHRSDRLEEIVGHLGRLGWGDVTVKRLPPAARVLVRARRADRADAARRRRRSRCIGRMAATPTRPRRSCVTPLRLPSEVAAPRQCRPCWVG